jgi:Ca2+-binding EF-hand superfamily protein
MFPDGEMTRESFYKFAAVAFEVEQDVLLNDATFYIDKNNFISKYDYLFQAMDRDKDGKVLFSDFISFQAITTNNNLNIEKLVDMVFEVYSKQDLNKLYITREDIKLALSELFVACSVEADEEVINKRVDLILLEADTNGDGRVSKEEIIHACKRSPSLLVMF